MKKKLIFVLVALTGMGMLIGPVLLGLVAVIFSASASVTQNPCITSVVNPVGGPVRLPVTGAFTVTSEYGMRYNPGPYGNGVYRLLYEGLSPQEAVQELAARELKHELPDRIIPS